MTRPGETAANRSWVAVLLLVAVVAAGCSASEAEMQGPQQGSLAAAEGFQIVAHRGVHQTFSREGVNDQTCTASRIDPPEHQYIENTLASMRAAFAAGASVVEIDIAPTSDGVLAVFHDWDVGCRTDAMGEIRSFTWHELSQLDIGYGYTADGETFPLRGLGLGLMPRLEEVFSEFPEGRFLINFKSDDPSEAALLEQVVELAAAGDQVWAVYGAPVAVQAYESATGTKGFTEASIRACLMEYLATVNDLRLAACEDTVVVVPIDIGPVLPGWPDVFAETMSGHGTEVIISGPGLAGIDSQADLDLVPRDFGFYVWTDRIDALVGEDATSAD